MDRAITILRAVGESSRLRIVTLLSGGELTVSELVRILGQSQPRVSRHLKLLTEAGVVERLPEGAWVFYRLTDTDDEARSLVDAAVAAALRDGGDARRDQERLREVKADRGRAATAYFRAVAQDWDRIRTFYQPEAAVECALLEAVGPAAIDTLVDVGTGTGRILQVLAGRVRRGIGIDLSHDMLTIARHNLEVAGVTHCSVRHADLYALPFSHDAADLVTVHQVLHYVDDPGRAVTEAARVLRPAGRMLIVDFAPHNLEFLRDEHAHRRLGFSDDEVEAWLARVGLELSAARALEAGANGLTVKVWTATATGAPRAKGEAA